MSNDDMRGASQEHAGITRDDHGVQSDQTIRQVDFLHEVGMLRHTPRTGYAFLGSGKESVAEHSHRMAVIGYVLASLAGADVSKTTLLCLFHDLGEARTGDLNYVNQLYARPHEREAVMDATEGTGLESAIMALWDEHHAGESLEAVLAHDADQLDLLLNLKRESDLGNPYAMKWFAAAVKRLRTPEATRLAARIREADHTDWWYHSRDPRWWETRDEAKR